MRCIILFALLLTVCFPCQGGAEEAWRPQRGYFSAEAEFNINNWIDENIPPQNHSYKDAVGSNELLKRLIKGTLIWAYSHGNTFNADSFLETFTNKDDSFKVFPLENGGLTLWLGYSCLKISIQKSSPLEEVEPIGQETTFPSPRWYAAIITDDSDIMFFFSGVSPFQAK